VLWPPQLDDLKAEIGRPRSDTADEEGMLGIGSYRRPMV
jgi:hypothetical protein